MHTEERLGDVFAEDFKDVDDDLDGDDEATVSSNIVLYCMHYMYKECMYGIVMYDYYTWILYIPLYMYTFLPYICLIPLYMPYIHAYRSRPMPRVLRRWSKLSPSRRSSICLLWVQQRQLTLWPSLIILSMSSAMRWVSGCIGVHVCPAVVLFIMAYVVYALVFICWFAELYTLCHVFCILRCIMCLFFILNLVYDYITHTYILIYLCIIGDERGECSV